MSRFHFLLLASLIFCFAVAPSVSEAGLGSLVRKAARKADDGAGGLGHKLDFDGLKHLDVEPGVSRFGLATHPDGSLSVKSMDGKELHIGVADDIDGALANFTKSAVKAGGKTGEVRFFVTPDDLFVPGKASPLLEKVKGLHVVTGTKTSLPVSRITDQAGKPVWGVKIRKGIIATTPDMRSFTQATFRMNHAFNAADIHIVSFSKKAPDFPDVLNYAKAGHPPKPTLINPDNLDDAFRTLRGKKLIVSGRVDGDMLLVKSASGPAQSLPLKELRRRAIEANVDLIVLGGKRAAQPGKKFDRRMRAAFQTERYGDFLAALGNKKSPMVMHMSEAGKNHLVWRSSPASGQSSQGLVQAIEEKTIGEAIAGRLLLKAGVRKAVEKTDEEYPEVSVELTAKSKEWQEELDWRIISFVPVSVQFLFLFNVIGGLLAWSTSSWLWDRIWRPADRSAFNSRWSWFGYRFLRTFLKIVLLMGLIGFILFMIQWVISAWQTFLGFLRVLTWPIRKLRGY